RGHRRRLRSIFSKRTLSYLQACCIIPSYTDSKRTLYISLFVYSLQKKNTPFYSHFAMASFRLGRFGVTRDDSDSEQERDQYHDPESPIHQDNNEEYTSWDPE